MARVILRDGRVAELRRARNTKEEVARIRELFAKTSPESLYFRFFHMIKEVDDKTIISMMGDGKQALALICLHEDEVVALGNYKATHDEMAEVAFLVKDGFQGRGIGSLLLAHLAEAAWLSGFRNLEAHILQDNYRMLQVFRASGFEMVSESDGNSVHLIWRLGRHEQSRNLQAVREKLATAASLHPFFQPKTVALIGASRNPKSMSHQILRNLLTAEFTGVLYPVHPTAKAIAGVRAYPSVKDIPDSVDLAVIAVPAAGVEDVVDDCLSAGVKAVMILSSGFSDVNAAGAELEQALLDKLRSAGCRLMGPNMLGVLNTSEQVRLNASFAPEMPKSGRVAIASHSGALGIAILDYASKVGVGVSSFASLGNRADVSGNDLLQYWETDSETDIILLYLETFGNPKKFSRITRRLTRNKPVLAVKSGRSPASLFASHRIGPALVHDDETISALFRQAGIIRADSLQEMFDITALLSTPVWASGDRVAIVTNTSGGAVLTADMLTRERLRLMHPVINLGFEALADSYREVLPVVLEDNSVDAVLVLYTPVGPSEEDEVAEAIADALREVRAKKLGQGEKFTKPVVANFLFRGDYLVRYIPVDTAYRVPIYPFPESAVRALARVVEYQNYRRSPVGRIVDLADFDGETVRNHVRQQLGSNVHRTLQERELRELVEMVGFTLEQLPEECRVRCSIRVESDPLFGNLLRTYPEGIGAFQGVYAVRLLPLTDLDADALARLVAGWFADAHTRQRGKSALAYYDGWVSDLTDFFSRLSQLVEDVPEVSGLQVTIGNYEGQIGWVGKVHAELGRPSESEGPVLE